MHQTGLASAGRWPVAFAAALSSGLVAAALFPMGAFAQSGGTSGEEVPRTAWGEPNLQGVWTSATLTPLERPSRQSNKTELTDGSSKMRPHSPDSFGTAIANTAAATACHRKRCATKKV